MDAGDDLDEGTFPSTVLTQQRVDAATVEAKVHALQSLHSTEAFGDAGELQHGGRRTHRLLTRRTSTPRARTAATASAGACSSLMTSRSRSVGQKVAIATRFHLVWSKTPITSLALASIAVLISAS